MAGFLFRKKLFFYRDNGYNLITEKKYTPA